MTSPIARQQFDPGHFFQLYSIPRDDDDPTLFIVGQNDPFLFPLGPSSVHLDHLDSVRFPSTGRSLIYCRRRRTRGSQVGRVGIQSIRTQVTRSGRRFPSGGREDEWSRGGSPNRITPIVMGIMAYCDMCVGKIVIVSIDCTGRGSYLQVLN
jgi:hypothetical protein